MNDINLYIDYKKVKENIDYLKKDRDVIMMVKANSYGIGFGHIKKLISLGYSFFGVTTIEEALQIREYNNEVEVMVFSPIIDYTIALENNIIATIIDPDDVIDGLRYHIKFDTGMGRLGIEKPYKHLKPEGIYTHFPMASNQEFSQKQIEELRIKAEEFQDLKYVHIQNTLGAILYDVDFCNLVRIGIGQFGLLSNQEEFDQYGENLQLALRLEVRVTQYKENYNDFIGYDLSEFVTGNIATIRMGYHDGLTRNFDGYQFKNGNKIVGLICMCQAMVKVHEKTEYIEIFGDKENIYDLLKYGRISSYEFLVALSTRVNKIEVNNG